MEGKFLMENVLFFVTAETNPSPLLIGAPLINGFSEYMARV